MDITFLFQIYRFRFVGNKSSSESESKVMPLFFLAEEGLDFLDIFGRSSSEMVMLSPSSSESKLLSEERNSYIGDLHIYLCEVVKQCITLEMIHYTT